MSLQPGARLGPYEIQSPLGAGGMGEVYRARDTKLNRDVAIKVLPEVVATDPERLARFHREAQVLASLNHPNIAAIYGFEDSNATHALVMELVEGPTLAEMIAGSGLSTSGSGPASMPEVQSPKPKACGLSLHDALNIARQLAEALESAHEQGIIHRDLKPANIKVRDDGTVKVLDFGLAKMLEPARPAGTGQRAELNLTGSPTLTSPIGTMAGMILGTAAYMSPEQAKGRPADRRSDLWSFGCVLYEMLCGRRPFLPPAGSDASSRVEGEEVAETLVAILSQEPDWAALPAATPAHLVRLLRLCLERDRHRRLQSAGDARIRLEEAAAEPSPAAREPSRGTQASGRLWMAASFGLLALVIALAVSVVGHLREAPRQEPPQLQTELAVPPTTDPVSLALSPDGRRLAFAAKNNGRSQLWVRTLASGAMQPIAGTEGGERPFWSPDSQSVGFFADGKLKVLQLDGGRPRIVADAIGAGGGSWNGQDVILFAPSTAGPVFRVSAAGGATSVVTTLQGSQQAHMFPQLLPDGDHFVFYARGTPDVGGIFLGTFDSTESKRLTPADSSGVYLSSGWLMWPRGGTLVAQQLDLSRLTLDGSLQTIGGPVAAQSNGSALTASRGLIAFRGGSPTSRRQLVWYDRTGRAAGTLGAPDGDNLNFPRLSPDGTRATVHRTLDGNSDIWILDGVHADRFTHGPTADRFATWSPDGRQIAFDSDRTGVRNLYVKATSGDGAERLLVESRNANGAASWSPDSRFVIYNDIKGQDYDISIASLSGDRRAQTLIATKFDEKSPDFSPDGHWVAYESNESGRYEIHVTPFVPPGERPVSGSSRQVSTMGGIAPAWGRDGRELFYIAPDGMLTSVSVKTVGTSIEFGSPEPLFHPPILGGGTENQQGRQYDVGRDGRFLVNTVLEDTTPITLLQNWRPEGKP